MPRKQHAVYGKKTTTASSLAIKCFLSDSSPAKLENGSQPSLSRSIITSKDVSRETAQPAHRPNMLGSEFEILEDRSLCANIPLDSPVRSSPRLREKRQKMQNKNGVLTIRDVNVTSPISQSVTRKLRTGQKPLLQHHTEIQIRSPSPPRDLNSSLEPSRARRLRTSLRTSLRSSLPFDFSVHNPDPLQDIVELCKSPVSFADWSASLATYFSITKIAEATYAEVFRLSLKSSSTQFSKSDESVLKIIALRPTSSDDLVHIDKPQTAAEMRTQARLAKRIGAMSDPTAVASEVRLLQRMSPVPGFTNFRDVKVVRGRPPKAFIAAWKAFNKDVRKSAFPDPSRKTSYSEDQLWAVVEMQDAGTDLETWLESDVDLSEMKTFEVKETFVWDVFWSVACALAKGEEWAYFEHRDLHLGNICIRPGQALRSTGRLGSSGIETTIIDYTLSRAVIEFATGVEDEQIAYLDLSNDSEIFEGNGADDYQYDIYRHMRSAMLYGDPLAGDTVPQSTREQTAAKKSRTRRRVILDIDDYINDSEEKDNSQVYTWRDFRPISNLVWLHFILVKLMRSILEGVPLSEACPRPPGGVDDLAQALEGLDLDEPRNREKCESAIQTKLRQLESMLALERMSTSSIRSSAELVGWAMEIGWLNEEDVVDCGLS